MRGAFLPIVGCASLALLWGCAAQRVLAVDSEPPGALVRLDDEIIGHTPLEYPFNDYGTRRVTLYLAGFRTWSERVELARPWHARFPIDLFTEVLFPVGTMDRHEITVELSPDDVMASEPDFEALLLRASELQRTQPGVQQETPDEGADEDGGGESP